MKRFLFIILLATPFLGKASHIVGGEFELIHLSENSYRLNLILYFDLHNGNPGAKDQSVTARIFRMFDNAVMMDVHLPLISETSVDYSQPDCSIGELQTSKLIYSSVITLSSTSFSHPWGYYISWERCCRNYEIDNIYSEVPNAGAIYAGQTFYLQIPPVVKNGMPFINSSPRLFPPLSDYACFGKPYYVDFSGVDNDGDSLVYSLTTPLNTKTGDALPLPNPPGAPRPRPYPEVTWKPGFSLDHIMQGQPDLAISNEGLLTVTPRKNTSNADGELYVFAVKCEEFRDGVKIGETRRDFQMLAVDCGSYEAPVIKGKKLGDSGFSYKDNMNIVFPPSIADEQRCIQVEITDNDILDENFENIKIRAKTIGNKKNINQVVLPAIKNATLNGANTSAVFSICFDECPLVPNTPYQIQIIASDDACAVPLTDTLRITVTVKTPNNSPAKFIDPDPDVSETRDEGSPKKVWPILAVDGPGDNGPDSLLFAYFTDGFLLDTVDMELLKSQIVQGTVTGSLSWEPKCDVDKKTYSVKRDFLITLVVDDKDLCSYNKPDTAHFILNMNPPQNADPIIDTDLTPVFSEVFVNGGTKRIFEKIEFNVSGQDADQKIDLSYYPISLKGFGIGYQLIDYQMSFPEVTGTKNISSHFSWPLECDLFDLSEKDSFNIMFIVEDKNNQCKIYQADTLEVAFKILPPINTPPGITSLNLHPETETGINTATSYWNQPIEFLLTGTDQDEDPVIDNLRLELYNSSGNVLPSGFSFNPVSGQKEISSKFIWTPDCSIFTENDTLNTYQFNFRVFDDHCKSADTARVTLNINIKDYKSTDRYFDPASIITPNEDTKNDYFALDGYDLRENGTDPDNDVNFPLDNCLNRFEYINIYNRWGKLVFTSDNRFFRWYAPNAAAGVYYYFVKFTNKDYKGSVTVRY